MVMPSTRARYHRAVRDLKRNQADLRRTKLADRAASGDSKHFWNEVKKLNGSKSIMPTQVLMNMLILQIDLQINIEPCSTL